MIYLGDVGGGGVESIAGIPRAFIPSRVPLEVLSSQRACCESFDAQRSKNFYKHLKAIRACKACCVTSEIKPSQ